MNGIRLGGDGDASRGAEANHGQGVGVKLRGHDLLSIEVGEGR
jgi:hypothetical protein